MMTANEWERELILTEGVDPDVLPEYESEDSPPRVRSDEYVEVDGTRPEDTRNSSFLYDDSEWGLG